MQDRKGLAMPSGPPGTNLTSMSAMQQARPAAMPMPGFAAAALTHGNGAAPVCGMLPTAMAGSGGLADMFANPMMMRGQMPTHGDLNMLNGSLYGYGGTL